MTKTLKPEFQHGGSRRQEILDRAVEYLKAPIMETQADRHYFCGNNCLFDFIRLHLTSIIAIAPRREALETPVKVVKEKYESHRYQWQGDDANGPTRVPYMAPRTTIKSVDNT